MAKQKKSGLLNSEADYYTKLIAQTFATGECSHCGGRLSFSTDDQDDWTFFCPSCGWAIMGTPRMMIESIKKHMSQRQINEMLEKYDAEERIQHDTRLYYCPTLSHTVSRNHCQ